MKKKKTGEELKKAKQISECAQLFLQLNKGSSDNNNELQDALLAPFPEEDKKCFEESKVVDKLKSAFTAIKDNLGVDLFQLSTGVSSSIEMVEKTLANVLGEVALNINPLGRFVIGVVGNNANPGKDLVKVDKFVAWQDFTKLYPKGFGSQIKSFIDDASPECKDAVKKFLDREDPKSTTQQFFEGLGNIVTVGALQDIMNTQDAKEAIM